MLFDLRLRTIFFFKGALMFLNSVEVNFPWFWDMFPNWIVNELFPNCFLSAEDCKEATNEFEVVLAYPGFTRNFTTLNGLLDLT